MEIYKDKLNEIRDRLHAWMIEDIKKASHMKKDYSGYYDDDGRENIKKVIPDYPGGAMIGGFVLSLNAIQVMSKLISDRSDRLAFKEFIEKFLPAYKGVGLYNLRTSLYKLYSARLSANQKGINVAGFALYSRNPEEHLTRDQEGRISLNLENLAKDIEKCFNEFFDEIEGAVDPITISKVDDYHSKYLMKAVGRLSASPGIEDTEQSDY